MLRLELHKYKVDLKERTEQLEVVEKGWIEERVRTFCAVPWITGGSGSSILLHFMPESAQATRALYFKHPLEYRVCGAFDMMAKWG